MNCQAHDPASIVDIKGSDELDQSAWGIDRGERAIAQKERIGSRVIGNAGNLAMVVDGGGRGDSGIREIDGRDNAIVQQKAVEYSTGVNVAA
jgi:hypothetical protein